MIGQTSPTVSLCDTTLAVDIIDGWGLSNEARHELLPKKSKVTLYCCSLYSKRRLTSCTLLTRWSKSGRAMQSTYIVL